MLKPWKLLTTTVVHETPWIEVKADLCEVGGKQLTYTYTRRKDEGPLIIAEEDGKLWMVRQYRHPVKKMLWQFPVEGKSPSETWEAAAARGIQEELGKHARTVIKLGSSHPDPGGLEQVSQYFYATDLESISSEHQSDDNEVEDLEQSAFTLEEINQMIESGEICDNWTLSALYLYQLYKSNPLSFQPFSILKR